MSQYVMSERGEGMEGERWRVHVCQFNMRIVKIVTLVPRIRELNERRYSHRCLLPASTHPVPCCPERSHHSGPCPTGRSTIITQVVQVLLSPSSRQVLGWRACVRASVFSSRCRRCPVELVTDRPSMHHHVPPSLPPFLRPSINLSVSQSCVQLHESS